MNMRMGVMLALLLAADAQAQEPDRHAARREWLAKRRAGELEDTAAAAAAVPRAQPGKPTSAPAASVPAEAAAPHRFAGRFRPNYEADVRAADMWPLQPLWSGSYGLPMQPWYGRGHGSQYRWWSAGYACARVTLSVMPGGRYVLFLFLPPANPYDADELELLLDRQLSAGQPVQLQTREGLWLRVQPGSRIESVTISACDER